MRLVTAGFSALFTTFSVATATEAQQQTVEAELVVATEVVDRQPQGAATTFPADVGRVVGWTRVTGAADTTIELVWRHEDLEFVVPLQIGGSPWRTWSTKEILPEWTGEWTLEVRDGMGNVIESATFTITET